MSDVPHSGSSIDLDPYSLDGVDAKLIETAQTLIRCPSLPGEEQAAARLLASALETLGYRDIEIDAQGNVVAMLGHGRPRLMYNGHLDHVPPDGVEEPYGGRIVDGRRWGINGPVLTGRGSSDMKANVVAAAFAAAFVNIEVLEGTYVFTADVQEETDSPLGVQTLLERGIRADYGLSGESTGLAVALGHRGKLQFDLVTHGRTSHAALRDNGINAVYEALPLIEAIRELDRELHTDPEFGPATLTVTQIASLPDGDTAVVPGSCNLRIDRRYVPGETPEACEAQLRDAVERAAAQHEIRYSMELRNVYPLMATDAAAPIVQAGQAAVADVTGRRPPLIVWNFGVNATFMNAAGIPSIGIGAGLESSAHSPDEHVSVLELLTLSRVVARLVERVCQDNFPAPHHDVGGTT